MYLDVVAGLSIGLVQRKQERPYLFQFGLVQRLTRVAGMDRQGSDCRVRRREANSKDLADRSQEENSN